MIRRLLAIALAVLAGIASPARAHTLSVSHVEIDAAGGEGPVAVGIDISIRDLALAVPLDGNRDEVVTWGELSAARGDIEALVKDNVVLSTQGGACRLDPQALAIRRYHDGAYASLAMQAHCPAASGLQLDYRLFRELDPSHRALVTLRRNGGASAVIARGEPLRFDVAVRGTSGGGGAMGSTFVDYLREGVHHILIGYDHLAFVLSLLLTAALVRVNGQWRSADGWRTSFVHVAGIITAFTVAHSITLTVAALGWVSPSPRGVEAAIAASVMLAAVNNVRPVVTRRLWVIGFVFGLIHGFGFAGVLGELGLPGDARALALLGFNLGVELGQIAVIALALPVLFAVRDRPAYARIVLPAVSLAIAALAAYWLWERLSGQG